VAFIGALGTWFMIWEMCESNAIQSVLFLSLFLFILCSQLFECCTVQYLNNTLNEWILVS
jgi:hypothetical protein